MTAILLLFLSILGWCLTIVSFEVGYKVFRVHAASMEKGNLCRLWWVFIVVLVFLSGPAGLLLNFPVIFVLSSSHLDLACRNDDVVTLVAVFRNIPASLRKTMARLRPFLK